MVCGVRMRGIDDAKELSDALFESIPNARLERMPLFDLDLSPDQIS